VKDSKDSQPLNTVGRTLGPRVMMGGSTRSVARLKQLNYDPIGELVNKYRKLEDEITYQEKLRSNAIVELNASGKPRAYRAEQHYALYDKLINISEKLLRYRYGRVPETPDNDVKPPSPLVINLTKKGETYIVNEEQEQPDRPFEDDDEDNGL
jgi:hypothetical protein